MNHRPTARHDEDADAMRHDPTPPTDEQLAARLREHLHQQAGTVHLPGATDRDLTGLRDDAGAHRARTRQRRLGALSVASVAASAVLIAAVVTAQGPRPVSADLDPAAPRTLAVATGSSTASATGSAKGWTYEDVSPAAAELPRIWLRVPGVEDVDLLSLHAGRSEQRAGRDAPDVAVLATVEPGSPLAFVAASVQDPDQLSLGKGGTMGTIDGRPARAIIDNHGWQRVVWSKDDDTHVLLQAYGVDRAALESAATSLHRDDAGTWVMDAGDTGLSPQQTVAPDQQRSADFFWSDPTSQSFTSLSLVTGGSYEMWAGLLGPIRFGGGSPEVVEVALGDGTTAPGILSVAAFGDGSDAELVTVTPDGVVIRVTRSDGQDPALGGRLRALLPTMLVRLDDEQWLAAIEAGEDRRAEQAASDRELRESAGATTTVVPPGVTAAPGGPASTAAPATAATDLPAG